MTVELISNSLDVNESINAQTKAIISNSEQDIGSGLQTREADR